MRNKNFWILMFMVYAAAAIAQQSASYKITSKVVDGGGTPLDMFPMSASFRLTVLAAGENTQNDALSSTSYLMDTGFVAGTIDITPPLQCLFEDDFEDGTVDLAKWTILKPNWTESSGQFVGAPTGKKAIVIAGGFPGCVNCSIQTTMQTAGGIGNRVWMLGWYIDKKTTIELMMKEEADRWIFKQKSAGNLLVKAKAILPINPGVDYSVELSFDGTNFHVLVNGTEILTVPAGAIPQSGSMGYETKGTTGRFNSVCIK
jgi:hypothetical protein